MIFIGQRKKLYQEAEAEVANKKQGIILAFITLEKKLLSDIITTPAVEGDFSRALKDQRSACFSLPMNGEPFDA